ncbi:MAG: hypothetical protein A2Y66_00450 [Nitrospirae bacterium RBG_13_41_22]|nr:MAG: hypothetical protein A2Y66_00450 [Nitrospirae bacterium RBG_13_41_22]
MRKLPDLKTESDVRRFWEKHSIADYWDDLKECDDTFKRPNFKPVTLKFDPIILKKIKMLARKRGVSYNAYIRYLLAKAVESDMFPTSR